MTDADIPIHRAIARQDVAERHAERDAERATPNAALCGARRFSDDDRDPGEPVADAGVADAADAPLTARQSRAAEMLAGGMSVREVAVLLDLHRGTVFRWRQSCPAFRREQRRCAAEASGELSAVARRLLVKATGYVDRAMEEDGARGDWAARILRNPRLWDLALATGGAEDL